MKLKEKILSREVVFEDYFTIEKWYYQFEKADGTLTEKVDRMCFQRVDSAAAVVYNTDSKKVIFVNQFRHCTYDKGPGWILEIPAGRLDEGEQPNEAIKRELIEEIGYKTKHIEKIAAFYASPGCMTERMHVYYAEVTNEDKVAEGGGQDSEHEYIEIVELTIEELQKALKNDGLPDAKSIIACNYLLSKLRA